MALSFPRWLAIAVIGFGIALVIIVRDVPERDEFVSRLSREERRANRARNHVAIASERLRVLQIIDSVKRSLGRSRSPQRRVALARNLEERMARAANQIVTELESRRSGPVLVPIDIAFVVDTASLIRGAPRRGSNAVMAVDHVLPHPGSDDRCLVLARTRPFSGDARAIARRYVTLLAEPAKERLLGPCAYYERFGSPGPSVAAWLRAREWSPALRSTWDRAARRWTWGWEPLEMSTLERESIRAAAIRNSITPTGVACLAGDAGACERAFLVAPNATENRLTLWSAGIVSSGDDLGFQSYPWWDERESDLGPRSWTLLSEMVRTLGPERFQRFWSSSQPIAEAFESASGQDIGVWTREWAQRMYGKQLRGPHLAGMSAASGVAFIVLAVAFAAVTARRRQVA